MYTRYQELLSLARTASTCVIMDCYCWILTLEIKADLQSHDAVPSFFQEKIFSSLRLLFLIKHIVVHKNDDHEPIVPIERSMTI